MQFVSGLTDMAYLFDYGRGYAGMINSGKGKALRQLENCFLAEEAIAARPPSKLYRFQKTVPRHALSVEGKFLAKGRHHTSLTRGRKSFSVSIGSNHAS